MCDVDVDSVVGVILLRMMAALPVLPHMVVVVMSACVVL